MMEPGTQANPRRTDRRLLFVTNFCSHYRVGAFEELSRRARTRFVFFSDAREGYWEKKNPVGGARIDETTALGIHIFPKVRLPLRLLGILLTGNYDAVIKCTNGRMELPLAFLASKLRRKKFVLWQTIWYHPQSIFHRLSLPILRAIWKRADAIVVYGQHGKDFLVGQGVKPEKVFIGWQAVDNSLYGRPVSSEEVAGVRTKLGVGDRNVVLYVGQFVPVKGLDVLVRAYQRMRTKDTCLVLVGRGEEEQRLRTLAAGAPDILFTGYLPPHQLAPLYAMASAFVLPSVDHPEGEGGLGTGSQRGDEPGVSLHRDRRGRCGRRRAGP